MILRRAKDDVMCSRPNGAPLKLSRAHLVPVGRRRFA